MERWLRIADNGHGEWSVLDLDRGYRICSFNHLAHGGPHLHYGVAVWPLQILDLRHAVQLARAYASHHEGFEWKRFKEVHDEWRSGPSTD